MKRIQYGLATLAVALLLVAWLLLLFGWLTAHPAHAKEMQLFVKNQPFPGTTRMLGRSLFAPLDELLGSLDCHWEQKGTLLEVKSYGSTVPGPPVLTVGTITFDGRPVHVNQQLYAGKVFVDVAQLARALEAPFRINLHTSTADLHAPLAATESQGAVHTRGDGRSSPLVLDKLSFALDKDAAGRELLRGYATYHNRGDKPLQAVVARVEVMDEQGHSQGRFAERLARLDPGQSHTYQFPVWANYSGGPVKVKPVVEFEHAP